jgi:hypothetical protein
VSGQSPAVAVPHQSGVSVFRLDECAGTRDAVR